MRSGSLTEPKGLFAPQLYCHGGSGNETRDNGTARFGSVCFLHRFSPLWLTAFC